jgi:thiol:disulfide interchange protein DsbG
VLAHIAATGAKIVDLGNSHGLRMVLARQGEEFMLFQVAPDGEAVVAGLQAELPAAKLLAAVENQATEIGTRHGLRGLFLRNGKHFQVLYVTPDGESVIPGVMWDATGKNVTREQIAPISGAVPTVVIGKDAAAEKKAAIEAVKETSFGTIGRGSAPRLWVFVDPLCGYSVRALQGVKPFAASGQVEAAIIPVAVLDDGRGRSTASALSLLSRPANEMIGAWEKGELFATAGPAAEMRLQKNMAVAEAIGLRGTPLILWRKADGSEGRLDGLPSDWKAIVDSMGGERHAEAR